MNAAQVNVVQTNEQIKKRVADALESFEGIVGNKQLELTKKALETTLGSSVKDLGEYIQSAESMIQKLAPHLFGGTQDTPEANGGKVIKDEPSTRKVDPRMPETFHGMTLLDPNTVEIRTSNFRDTYKIWDPEITGEMVPVTSTNVHSIGFQMNLKNPLKSVLLVRYLQGDKGAKSKGPMYGYADVHPKLFREFTVANSKGEFVWDELRIRGTIAGAQYRYTLLNVVGGNVPRRALLINGIQWLKRRTKVSADGRRTVRSRLQTERRGPYRPTSSKPNRGNPNRGR